MSETTSTGGPVRGSDPATAGPGLLLVAVALWPALPLAVVPFWYGKPFFTNFDTHKLLVLVVGAAALSLRTWLKGTGRGPRPPGIELLTLIALAAAATGLLAEPARLVTGAVVALAALAPAWIVSTQHGVRGAVLLARAAAVVTALAAVYGIAQAAGLDRSTLGDHHSPASFFGNPSFAGEFLAAALPLAGLLALGPGMLRRDRGLGIAAVLLGLTHLVLTRSRIDFIAAGAAVAVAAVLLLHGRGRKRAAWIVGGGGLVVAAVVAAGFVAAAAGVPLDWLGRSDTLAVRADVWSATVSMIADSPLLPSGEAFADLYPAWRHADEFRLSLGRGVTTPHNDLLSVAVTLRLVGVLFVLLAVYFVARRVTSGNRATLPHRAAVAGSLVAVVVSGAASSPLAHPTTALLAALCVGALFALRPSPTFPLGRRDRRVPRHLHLVAAVGLAAFVWPGPVLRDVRVDAFVASARTELRANRGRDAIPWLELAVDVDPDAFVPRYELGTLLLSAGDTDQAIEHLNRAHRIRPGSLDARVNLANALRKARRRPEARALVDRSLEICGWHPLLLTSRAALAMDEGDTDTATACLDRAAPLLVNEPRLAVRRAEVRLVTGPQNESFPMAVDAVKALLAHGEHLELKRAGVAFARRDPAVSAALVAFAKRIAKDRPEDAVAVIFAVEPACRDDADFFYDGAQALSLAGRRDLSRSFNGHAWGVRARAQHLRGQNQKALVFLEKALDRAPTTEHFLLHALVLAALGEKRDAVRAIGQSLAVGSFDPERVRAQPGFASLLGDREFEAILSRAEARKR